MSFYTDIQSRGWFPWLLIDDSKLRLSFRAYWKPVRKKLYRFFTFGFIFILPVFYSIYNWNYLRNKIDRLYIDQSRVFQLICNFQWFPWKPHKRYGFADKIISQRESRALNLMSISFLLTYVISYWPLLGFHILRCFEYEGLSAKVCQKSPLYHF